MKQGAYIFTITPHHHKRYWELSVCNKAAQCGTLNSLPEKAELQETGLLSCPPNSLLKQIHIKVTVVFHQSVSIFQYLEHFIKAFTSLLFRNPINGII